MTSPHRMNIAYNVVLGCPRSGTTFLMEALDVLPRTEALIGNLIPICVPHLVNQELPEEVYQTLLGSVDHCFRNYLESGLFNSRAAALRKWFNERPGLGTLPEVWRGQRPIDRFIYKEPFLAFAPGFVYNALPEARLIHIHRDGRDVANSLVKTYDVLTDERLVDLTSSEMPIGRKVDHRYVPWWVEEGREEEFLAATPYVRSVWMWKAVVRRCHDFFSQPDVQASGRVLLLRYRDLVSEPVRTGRIILEHLGFEPGDYPRFYERLQGAHTRSVGSFKKRDPAEVAAAERIAGEELKLYGYL